jgi:hypothetical protein
VSLGLRDGKFHHSTDAESKTVKTVKPDRLENAKCSIEACVSAF